MITKNSSSDGRKTRILLSLDGGGVRGLSSILILKQIMDEINDSRPEEEEDLRPCDVFDLIGGTSTGGIIATMLGRLQMTVDECEAAYLKLSRMIFTPKRQKGNVFGKGKDFLNLQGRFDAEIMEKVIKEELRAKLDAETDVESTLLRDESLPCKIFVVTARQNNSEVALLRSYKNRKATNVLLDECKIWQACRATSAATTFFDPIKIGSSDQAFIDGAIIYNNPVQLVRCEAKLLWPADQLMIISIGTGSPPGKPFHGSLMNVAAAVKKIVTQTERTAHDFYKQNTDLVESGCYYRFNVTHGLPDVGLEEWREVGAITDFTETYLEDGEVASKRKACVNKMLQVLKEDALEDADSVDSQDWETLRKDIANWFSSAAFRQRQKELFEKRFGSTGNWFIQSQEFRGWLESENARLWCFGNPGAGKSVISSVTINHILEAYGDDSTIGICFIHYNHLDPNQSFLSVSGSLAHQLMLKQNSKIESIYERYRLSKEKQLKLSQADIIPSLKELCGSYRKTYIILDGLDECKTEREIGDVVKCLSAMPNANILAFSRDMPFIRSCLQDYRSMHFRAAREDVDAFVEDFIKGSYYLSKNVEGVEGLQETVREGIIRNSNGMFLLAKLQLKEIEYKHSPRDVMESLGSMGETQESIYAATVERIKSQSVEDAELALRTIAWIAQRGNYGSTFSLSALQHALSLSPTDEDLTSSDLISKEVILSVCAGLVVLEERAPDEEPHLKLVHETAYSFFSRWALHDHTIFSNPHPMFAQACLTYLNFHELGKGPCLDRESLRERMTRYPFAKYAAQYFAYHIRESKSSEFDEAASRLIQNPQKCASAIQLFKSESAEFAVFPQEDYKNVKPQEMLTRYIQSWTSFSSGQSHWPALQLAIEYSLRGVLQLMLGEKTIQARINEPDAWGTTPLVRSLGSLRDTAISMLLDAGADPHLEIPPALPPLHYAVDKANTGAVDDLLKGGADPNRQDINGRTPLQLILDQQRYISRMSRMGIKGAAANFNNTVNTLLVGGANIHHKDEHGRTSFHLLAILVGVYSNPNDDYWGHRHLLSILKNSASKFSPDLNTRGNDGMPLLLAANSARQNNRSLRNMSTELIRAFVSLGADINIRCSEGISILHHYASGFSKIDTLLELGANPSAKTTNNGLTSLHYLALPAKLPLHKNMVDSEGLDIRKSNLEALLKHGVDINDQTNAGETPLFLAATAEGYTLLPFLLEKGANPHIKTSDGLLPLHGAAQAGAWQNFSCLLKAGADINEQCFALKTALHYATESGSTRAAIEFCKLGANVNIKCSSGRTALHYLCARPQSSMPPSQIDKIHRDFQQIQQSCEGKRYDAERTYSCDSTGPDSDPESALREKNEKLKAIDDEERSAQINRDLRLRHVSDLDVLRVLVEVGVEVEARDKDGSRAIDYARRFERGELVAELEKRNVHIDTEEIREGVTVVEDNQELGGSSDSPPSPPQKVSEMVVG